MYMKNRLAIAAVLSCVILLAAGAQALAQSREEVTIYRDEFGTPHIFAATAEGGVRTAAAERQSAHEINRPP